MEGNRARRPSKRNWRETLIVSTLLDTRVRPRASSRDAAHGHVPIRGQRTRIGGTFWRRGLKGYAHKRERLDPSQACVEALTP